MKCRRRKVAKRGNLSLTSAERTVLDGENGIRLTLDSESSLDKVRQFFF